ncbi:MAG: GNAT family N-acetyltransferase [Gammaproteobacteria bacterium]|nr:GNAT family N-acetyltransferase [Gammaproteobacteria bacterium]
MTIQYKYLTEDDFPEAHATMVEAFSDYQLDMSYMTSERSWLRNLKSGVHYDCSVGAYDGEKMVGFTFVGLDDWQGEKAAFDAGTGIIPGYRGQGMAKAMFEFILPRLRERGVSTFLLEVLKPNKAAIRAYTKTGFKPTREFACYDLLKSSYVVENSVVSVFEVRDIENSGVQEFETMVDWQPSWEHSFTGMDRIADNLISLGAFSGGQCVGILVYYPLLQWVMCLVVLPDFRRRGVASSLLKALMEDLPEAVDTVKINNIDRSDKAMLAFFEKAGATLVIDQFEMEYKFHEQ